MRFGQTIDRVIAPFFPGLAARRAAARVRFGILSDYQAKQDERLSIYAGAEKSRKNRDWNPRRSSADRANLSDYDTLLIRSRSLMRDHWAAKSIVEAFGRNAVARGIMPLSAAKTKGGKELRKFNAAMDDAFNWWASRRKHCDVAQKQTFWAKQRMAVEEMVGVGEHIIVWSYTPNPETVGLRLQSYEPEQFDIVKLQNPDNGNFIRRGIEVDSYGAPIAYWLYERPLNDWFPFLPSGITGSIWTESKRIPAENVFHVMNQKRSRESHGVTWLTASMNKLRDMYVADDATLMTMKLEAFHSILINREDAGTSFNGALPPRLNQETDEAGNPVGPSSIPDDRSRDGGRQYAMEPGLVFEGNLGEKVSSIPKATPGQTYDPFMKTNLRGASAGVGLSYDVVSRDYDGGNYSSKRQGMLEDRRGYGMVQDALVDELVCPVRELFARFAILEESIEPGRYGLGVTMEQYLADPKRYSAAEFVPDGFEWVDPAKEAAAASVALDKRLITRKEICAKAGRNWRNVMQQIADEQAEADRVGISLPDVEPKAPATAGDAPPVPGQDDNQTPDGEPADGDDTDEDDQSGKSDKPMRKMSRRQQAIIDRSIEKILLAAVSE